MDNSFFITLEANVGLSVIARIAIINPWRFIELVTRLLTELMFYYRILKHSPLNPPLIGWCLQGLPSPLRQAFFYITNWLNLTLNAFVLNLSYLLLVDRVFLGNPDAAIRVPFAGLDNFQIRHKRVGSLQAGLGSQGAIDFLN